MGNNDIKFREGYDLGIPAGRQLSQGLSSRRPVYWVGFWERILMPEGETNNKIKRTYRSTGNGILCGLSRDLGRETDRRAWWATVHGFAKSWS